jgi:hypothetical protein
VKSDRCLRKQALVDRIAISAVLETRTMEYRLMAVNSNNVDTWHQRRKKADGPSRASASRRQTFRPWMTPIQISPRKILCSSDIPLESQDRRHTRFDCALSRRHQAHRYLVHTDCGDVGRLLITAPRAPKDLETSVPSDRTYEVTDVLRG